MCVYVCVSVYLKASSFIKVNIFNISGPQSKTGDTGCLLNPVIYPNRSMSFSSLMFFKFLVD